MLKKYKLFEKESFYTWMTFLFLLGQWIVIAITSVNVPAGDEWEILRSNAFPNGFTVKYIFDFHNEHRIVFTKLLNYLFLYLTRWNIQMLVVFNYCLFISIVYFLIRLQKKYILNGTKGLWFLPFFLASPLLVDNHNWGFQSQFHFFILFGLLSIFVSTKEKLRVVDYLLAVTFALCSAYSFSAGMFFSVVVLFVLLFRVFKDSSRDTHERISKVSVLLILVLGLALWFIGYAKPPEHPVYTFPTQFEFWYFWANLVSLGYGFKSTNIIVALLAVGITFFTLVKMSRLAFSFKNRAVSVLFFSSIAIIVSLLSIAASRAVYGIGQAKTSRYSEISILLMLFCGWLFWIWSRGHVKREKIYQYFVWFLVIGFAGDYSYSAYFSTAEVRREALTCIARYYQDVDKSGMCQTIYPASLSEMLENAKKLNISWAIQN